MSLSADTIARLAADPAAPIPAGATATDRRIVDAARRACDGAAGYRAQHTVCATPDAAAAVLAPILAGRSTEALAVLCLDTRARPIGAPIVVSQGDIDGTEAGPRVVYRHAVAADAAGVIVAHCHPTGDPTPSAADRQVTDRLAKAGRVLGIPLHDHLILARDGWVSLRRDEPSLFGGAA